MPHTSRKKRPTAQSQKRLQVIDDDGWTHVTSSQNVRRTLRGTQSQSPNQTESNATNDQELVFGPAEAPARLTLEELQTQYRAHYEKWINSETWAQLRTQLARQLTQQAEDVAEAKVWTPNSLGDSLQKATNPGDVSPGQGPIDTIVCVGLGSPSGFLRGGWVDRRSVSMYQLAALDSLASQILSYSSSSNLTPNPNPLKIYAQDPVFNTLDTSLLSSLGITVISHPAAFNLITPHTLLFCPGAEKKHLEQLLAFRPRMVFGGPLEDTDSAVIQGYLDRTRGGSICLVPFEACEHAFWRTRVYYREAEGGDDEEEEGRKAL
ncbi:hypothetical protein PDE_09782 [Penicillium oxalicum 114-2]|uniref:SRR1-like domain-containing protein n=1 Tax=Penicillium oxalicum (strain 114-2 / CGMCC 5302) TaxID=933388 RepID=S8B7B0_PENO1|nr:hypothetical protein PDE_09782 [Penicillium oxalicum 114-2]